MNDTIANFLTVVAAFVMSVLFITGAVITLSVIFDYTDPKPPCATDMECERLYGP